MRLARTVSFVLLALLLAVTLVDAGGAKTPITFETIGGSGASAAMSLCGAAAFPCTGQTFVCPGVSLFAGDLITKSSCGPAGFKVTHYQYSITSSAGGCLGVAQEGDTVTCGPLADGSQVLLKAGHGKFP